jgi:Antibiotic biosynthesis monooxygenase
MHARLVMFTFGPGKRAEAQAIADNLAPQIASQPGCESVTVFGDDSDSRYGIFVLWDSEANADAAARVIRPQLDEHLSGNAQGPPTPASSRSSRIDLRYAGGQLSPCRRCRQFRRTDAPGGCVMSPREAVLS